MRLLCLMLIQRHKGSLITQKTESGLGYTPAILAKRSGVWDKPGPDSLDYTVSAALSQKQKNNNKTSVLNYCRNLKEKYFSVCGGLYLQTQHSRDGNRRIQSSRPDWAIRLFQKRRGGRRGGRRTVNYKTQRSYLLTVTPDLTEMYTPQQTVARWKPWPIVWLPSFPSIHTWHINFLHTSLLSRLKLTLSLSQMCPFANQHFLQQN